jgi:hypothetical protein
VAGERGGSGWVEADGAGGVEGVHGGQRGLQRLASELGELDAGAASTSARISVSVSSNCSCRPPTAGLPDDACTRYALRGYLEFGTLVAVRNSHTTSDAELHPCQEVPRWGW